MIKHLTVLIALLMTIGSQVSAAETVMVCGAENRETRYYKLVSPFFGKAKVEQKRDGKWVDWCHGENRTVTVYETAARCEFKNTQASNSDYPEYGIEKGQQVTRNSVLLIDFEFATRIHDDRLFGNNGTSLVEIINWEHRRTAIRYACEKND